VLEVRIRIDALGPARERSEGLRGDELLRAARQERSNVVTCLDEQPRELAPLVSRNTTRYAEQDLRHG
jgi:hypothetical protein